MEHIAIPGRIGFKIGLTSDPVFFKGLLRENDSAAGPEGFDCRFGGAKLLLIPRRPRFMILAGVTGVSGALRSGEGGTKLSKDALEDDAEDEEI